MASGIPYSFVPGTKAKADEVNANFLAVLNKIEETNSAKLNVDLSNIDETGKATLDVVNTKADKKELDGEWQYCHYVLALDVPLTSPTPLSFDLSTYIPKDDNIYEILLSARVVTAGGNGMYSAALIKSSLMPDAVYFCNARARTTNSATSSGCGIIPLGKDRVITAWRTADYSGKISISFDGFRKVR